MPLPTPTARQFFGIGKQPVDEYFAPVVPSMAGRLTGNQNLDARQWLEQNRLDQIQNQFAQQQEQMRQQEFERQQAEQQRAFQNRFQTIMGPEWEQAQMQSYQQRIGKQNQQGQVERQKQALFSALSGIDVRSDDGRREVDRLIGANPLAATDADVGRYLTARGYDPRNKEGEREEYRRESWLGRLPTEHRVLADRVLGQGGSLADAQSAVLQEQRNGQLQEKILGAGIDPNELDTFRDEAGNFDEKKVLPRIYQERQKAREEQYRDRDVLSTLSALRQANSSLAALTDKREKGADGLDEPIEQARMVRDSAAAQLRKLGVNMDTLDAPKQQGTAAPQGVSIPPAHINYLKAHPEAAKDFDAKYGAGASAKVIGKK